MSKKLLTVLAVSAVAISTSACSYFEPAPTITKAPGVYKTTTKSTNSNGTNTSTKQTTSVYRDTDGDKKAVVKTETTRDPEGLFNKSKTTSTKTYN